MPDGSNSVLCLSWGQELVFVNGDHAVVGDLVEHDSDDGLLLDWSDAYYIEGFHVTSLQQNLPSHAAHSGHAGSHKIWPYSLLLKLHKA